MVENVGGRISDLKLILSSYNLEEDEKIEKKEKPEKGKYYGLLILSPPSL